MRLRVLVVFVACVCGGVSASASRRSKIERRFNQPEGTRQETHYIYPRTGRLFHADYIRDNEIFKSLERTNFMRRGPFARSTLFSRPKKNGTDSSVEKTHIYVGTESVLRVGMNKGSFSLEKDIPPKAELLKITEPQNISKTVSRQKRSISDEKEGTATNDANLKLKSSIGANMDQQNLVDGILHKFISSKVKDSINDGNVGDQGTLKFEKEVEEDNFPHIQTNDTDKTLFVHDQSKHLEDIQPEDGQLTSTLDKFGTDEMKRIVVDDNMNLYPVYSGVNYHYPLKERHLVYSPEMTVQMDVPVVSEYHAVDENNSTSEGRSRRPLKKLALPLLLALKLKTAILLPLILGLISLISFKGLWSGLTALGIAAALGLKALVVSSGPKVVVQNPLPPPPPPHVHHFGPHEYAEYWNRRGDDYSDYRPTNNWA